MAIRAHRILKIRQLGGLILALWMPGVLLPGETGLYAQESVFDPAFTLEAARIREEVSCFTDRSLYVTGEMIRFSAGLKGTGPAARGPWSTVLYAELVGADGTSLARGKYPVREGRISGEILIPAEAISGHYFLRCYTRWMRNRGPESYAFVPLRIINPDRSTLEQAIPPDEADARLAAPSPAGGTLDFKRHPGTYEAGSPVSMQLSIPGNGSGEPIRGCLTVVPSCARPVYPWTARLLKRDAGTDSAAGLPDSAASLSDSAAGFQLHFLPDKFGPTLSGSVVDAGSGNNPLPGTRVHITLMGDQQGYLVCRTDALGRFSVALPYHTGELELFIQPESMENPAAEVRIDREFDHRQLSLAAGALSLNSTERRAATIMARNAQLARIYREPAPRPQVDPAAGAFPFYGSATRTVDLDRYVLLPKLEEIFMNLVPGVTPVTRRNKNSLQIYSENPALSMFDPLIMVDQVPVFDLDKFMSVSPAKIRYIDVIEDVYVKGDMRFGGLINLRSREGDVAGIDLPRNSFFFDYQAMHPSAVPPATRPSGEERWPDTRNTLLWMPDVVTGTEAPLGISFPAPEYPGEYVVLFRGLGPGELPVVAETSFRVEIPATE